MSIGVKTQASAELEARQERIERACKVFGNAYTDKNAEEISVNKEGEFWISRRGGKGWQPYKEKGVTVAWAEALVNDLALFNEIQYRASVKPILAARMPQGHRFQSILGKQNVESGICLSIRLKRNKKMTAKDFGFNDDTDLEALREKVPEEKIKGFKPTKRWFDELIEDGGSVMVSGGTSTGKTTFTNTCAIPNIPAKTRVIAVEDVAELDLSHFPNSVRLLVPRVQAANSVTNKDMIDSLVRLSPECILLGEISTGNTVPTFRLMNTGHASFVMTIHANSPREAITAFLTNYRENTPSGKTTGVADFLIRHIDVIVQLGTRGNGERGITQICCPTKDLSPKDFTDD